MAYATIIGSGPAGLCAAYFLLQRGMHSTVISADDGPGGLARPIPFAGRWIDPGPHSFYPSYPPEAFALLNTFFRPEELHRPVPRKAVITARFSAQVPPRPRDLLSPSCIANALVMRMQRTRMRSGMPASARDAALHRYGERSVEVLFDPWCRKFFGVGADRLDPVLVQLLANARRGRERLVHPRSGAIGELWLRLADHLAARGILFRWNERVTGLERPNGTISGITTVRGSLAVNGPVIASAPLQHIVRWCGLPVVGEEAPAQSMILVFLTVARYRTRALYLTDHRVEEPIGRISFCDNWRPGGVEGPAVICAEFWCSSGDSIHAKPSAELVHHVQRYLQQHALAVPDRAPAVHVIGPVRGTPVPLIGHAAQQAQLLHAVAAVPGLSAIGRHAKHRWDGVDDAIMEAHHLSFALAHGQA